MLQVAFLTVSFVLAFQATATPRALEHRPAATQVTAYAYGPDGLEAWTDDHHTKQFRVNTEPLGIVIARRGKRIRYIGNRDGGPFFWNVMLLPDGKRVAYQTGPFHTSMTCTLMDIDTGKHLQDVACFSEKDEEEAPQWAGNC